MKQIVCAILLCLVIFSVKAQTARKIKYETINLKNENAGLTIELAYVPGMVPKYSAILMLGSLRPNGDKWEVPSWSTNLLQEGYMLVAFKAAHEPDPDSTRRPQWLYFDERFAHSYVQGGWYAIHDAGRVIDYLQSRGDVHKFGWIGSSSTGIPGLAVATREPRLGAIVAFVSTGAYRSWLKSWQTNGLWRGKTTSLWPETEALLPKVDPILYVKTMYPCAVLMVSGGADKVVDAKTAQEFVDAARPYYEKDPDRLRLVVYDGFSHNLPSDVVPMFTENWFRLYLNPGHDAPAPPAAPKDMNESVKRTSITGADHKAVTGSH